MSFDSLNKDELDAVTKFFAVDVEAANEDKGPTKKEYIAALESGDDPVTWEDYKEVYVPAKESGQDVNPEVKAAEEAAKAEAEAREAEEAQADAEEESDEEEPKAAADEGDEPVDEEDFVIVKFERKNPTFEVYGYRFTKAHPYARVPEEVATKLVQEQTGFRIALPKEVADYYN